MRKKLKKESPIKENPLPRAGHSLQKMIYSKFIMFLIVFIVPTAALLGILVCKLIETYFSIEISFSTLGNIWGICMGLVYLFMKSIESQMEIWFQGRDGEVFVAEQLDCLKEFGCKVLHDFVEKGTKWNIDHIVIAPQGIFTIETKTPSKLSAEKNEHILYDGKTVKRESGLLIETPLIQAKSAAKQLSNFIKKHLSMELAVQPIVVYPGWFVEGTRWDNKREHKVWVCNQGFLMDLICNNKAKLSDKEVRQIYAYISDYSRNRSE